jgi:tripartite ATP-independent transporter DctM subunit
MAWYLAGALMVAMVVITMAIGVPVSFAFLGVSMLGVMLFMGGADGLRQLALNATDAITTFTLVPIPLFLLMGALFFHTRLAVRVFDALDGLFGRLPGRLAYITVAGGTIFSALSGSSMANTAMLGSLLVPEMQQRGYKKYISIGPVVGTGGLAMIIPPSGLAVLLGSLARIDIGALLIGGVLPGLLLAVLYISIVFAQVHIDPKAAPSYEVVPTPLLRKIALVVVNILPMGLVVFAVIGLIILGVATPTEAAAFGALGVLILAIVFRCLTWDAIVKSLRETLAVTAMIFLIMIWSTTFSQVLAFSGVSAGMISWATSMNVSPVMMLLVMLLVVLFLGCLMEQVSIMMLTLPIFMPLVSAMQFDPVWFGVLMLLALEIGLITPPFGLSLFVMMGVTPGGATLQEVTYAALPYILCNIVVMVVIVTLPPIATWLPRLMH